MKNIFKSLLVVVAVAAVAGGATYSYFSDTATISGNTFTAGTMDLKIDQNVVGTNYDWVDDFNVSTDNVANLGFRTANGWTGENYGGFTDFLAQSGMQNLFPGMPEREQIIDIKNVGSIANPMATIDLNRTSGWSDLAGVLNFKVYFKGDHDDANWGDAKLNGTVNDYNKAFDLGTITDEDGIASVKIVWTVPETAGNSIQGDIVTVNAVFGLNQVANQVN